MDKNKLKNREETGEAAEKFLSLIGLWKGA